MNELIANRTAYFSEESGYQDKQVAYTGYKIIYSINASECHDVLLLGV